MIIRKTYYLYDKIRIDSNMWLLYITVVFRKLVPYCTVEYKDIKALIIKMEIGD